MRILTNIEREDISENRHEILTLHNVPLLFPSPLRTSFPNAFLVLQYLGVMHVSEHLLWNQRVDLEIPII